MITLKQFESLQKHVLKDKKIITLAQMKQIEKTLNKIRDNEYYDEDEEKLVKELKFILEKSKRLLEIEMSGLKVV